MIHTESGSSKQSTAPIFAETALGLSQGRQVLEINKYWIYFRLFGAPGYRPYKAVRCRLQVVFAHACTGAIYRSTYLPTYLLTYLYVFVCMHACMYIIYEDIHPSIHPLHYITLHYITLHYITLHYITLHYITLQYSTVQYITVHYITVHYTRSPYLTLHGINLPYLTSLRYATPRYACFLLRMQLCPKPQFVASCLGILLLSGVLSHCSW